MDALAEELVRLIRVYGPPVLTVLAFLETSFITGLVVPAGVALSLAAFMAASGAFPLLPSVVAAVLGAFLGDSAGFWIGRKAGRRVLSHRGLPGRLLAGHRGRLRRLLEAPPWISVTLARVVAFVRTLMPVAAGAGTMRYHRFLAWDAIGIALWALTYAAVGYLAGDSWQRLSRVVGAGWSVLFLSGVLAAFLARRRRNGRGVGMTSVGLTGNAASGKSTVAGLWQRAGVPVVSADQLARDAVAPGSEGLNQIAGEFGHDLVLEDGTLDRAALRSKVLASPRARVKLERILHPRIQALREAWLAKQREAGVRLVVSEIPLLFETGVQTHFDVVVVVHAPRSLLLERLRAHRGLEAAEAEALLEAQIPSEENLHLADHVITNTGSVQDLTRSALALLDQIRAGRRARVQDSDASSSESAP